VQVFVGLLRAVNVGGIKLLMSDLRDLCTDCGLLDARTYIQSGNVLFRSDLSEVEVEVKLTDRLAARLGREAKVHVRAGARLAATATHNPWPDDPKNRIGVLFVDAAPTTSDLAQVDAPGGEEVHARGREIYVRFPDGMGRSKLKIPFAAAGTMRNMNTVEKLAVMAAGMGAEA
jgi:uncharacterized protein (DUF1697 family)